MLDHVETMFDNIPGMLKKLKKRSYESNMTVFREKNQMYFAEITDYVDGQENKEGACSEIAGLLADAAEKRFAGSNGKIKARQQADLNFFMIYYTFPAILLTENENANLIAQSLCDEWGKRFKNSNISYTDYDSIYNTFNEKILGIF
ncbi:MAG: hypothetical protein PHQ72_02465 [Hespellia sp.]|nr:hypothetical protein [Hespellia sp.]